MFKFIDGKKRETNFTYYNKLEKEVHNKSFRKKKFINLLDFQFKIAATTCILFVCNFLYHFLYLPPYNDWVKQKFFLPLKTAAVYYPFY